MDNFNQIGTGLGRAELAVAKVTGQVIGFTHRANLPTALHCSILDNRIGAEDNPNGRQLEKAEITIIIPVQTFAFSGVSGFSGISAITSQTTFQKPITIGDRIEWPIGSSRYFYVDADVEVLDNGYNYKVHGKNQRTLTAGQNG